MIGINQREDDALLVRGGVCVHKTVPSINHRQTTFVLEHHVHHVVGLGDIEPVKTTVRGGQPASASKFTGLGPQVRRFVRKGVTKPSLGQLDSASPSRVLHQMRHKRELFNGSIRTARPYRLLGRLSEFLNLSNHLRRFEFRNRQRR